MTNLTSSTSSQSMMRQCGGWRGREREGKGHANNRWEARMQMTARGKKMKLVTTLQGNKKDSSQQSRRGLVVLEVCMGYCIFTGCKTLRESHPSIWTPASSYLIIHTGVGPRLAFRLANSSAILSKLECRRKAVFTAKLQGQITSTLLGEAWQNLPKTYKLTFKPVTEQNEKGASYTLLLHFQRAT